MKKIATDTYTLSKLLGGGFAYVDKSGAILPLVDNSIGSQFFCARPRRFGKSLAISTPQFVYVFEFKIRGASEEAMAQIEEKGYAAKFASDPRKVFKIGCAFDWEQRNLGRWIVAYDMKQDQQVQL